MAEDTKKTKTRTQTVEEVVVEVQEMLEFDIDNEGTITKTPIEKFNELAKKVDILDHHVIDLVPRGVENQDIAIGKAIWVRYETTKSRILRANEGGE